MMRIQSLALIQSLLGLAMVILLAAMPDKAAAETTFTAEGNPNPTLAFNTGSSSERVPAMQFLDIAKTMRPWVGHKDGQWGGMTYEKLLEGGYIDADGWVRKVPAGLERVGTIWQWSKSPKFARHRIGRYILTYEGEGTLTIGGDVRVIERAPGRIVFANRKGKNMYLNLKDLDPKGTGNYIRNISIVAEKHAELFALGGRFNPDWLKLVADARFLRFMNWTRTNNATLRRWEDRPTPDDVFSGRGVPVEYLVQLANEVGADPWFTMPHDAEADYVRNFARYVRDNLDPALVARVEYSNETWNTAFKHTRWLARQAKDAGWGDARHAYHTKRATEVALIWNEVFGTAAKTRLRHVMGAQAVNAWGSNQRLEAEMWRKKEPGAFVPPATIFDELAITHYFGSPTVRDPDMRTELLQKIRDPRVDAEAWLAKRLMDPRYDGSIPALKVFWQEQANVAKKHGLRLVAYEGGQHVHHFFAIKGVPKKDVDTLTTFMAEFVRSAHMADLYEASWQAWAEVSDGPFMQYEEIGLVSKWGAWGLRSSLDDTSPRAERVDRLNARSTPWWDSAGGPQYQQGVVRRGSDASDTLRGTLQEDYLIGKGGDDILQPGPGDDGIHGGAGYDRVALPGTLADHELRLSGAGITVSGPGGRDMLISVEQLDFAEGGSVVIADLVEQPDGTLRPASP